MLEIVGLTCQGLSDPIGLQAEDEYRFAWKLNSDVPSLVQDAMSYQLIDEAGQLVCTGEEPGAEQSVRVSGMNELSAGKPYRFELKVSAGGMEAAAACRFLIGKRPGDWKAVWIGPQRGEDTDSTCMVSREEMVHAFMGMVSGEAGAFTPDRQLRPVLLFRRSFTVEAGTPDHTAHAGNPVASALLTMTAHGIYEAYINGRPVSNTRFAPGFTAYESYLEAQTYEVASLIVPGENVLTVFVADGWYRGKFGILGYGNNYGTETALLAELEITSADGSRQTIATDHSFTYTESMIRYADFLIGEKQDTRIDDMRWMVPGEDSTELCREAAEAGRMYCAEEKAFGYDNLMGVTAEPVRVVDRLTPSRIFRDPKGDLIIDIGQNMVGVLEMTVQGEAGAELSLEHSEVLDEKGCFLQNISGFNRDQQDLFILNGSRQTLSPHFTFHGFRYVRVRGYEGDLQPEQVTALVLASDLVQTGTFHCSDERLNQLQSNIFWSQRGNMLSIPTDCPQRERAGWTGDIQVYGPTAAWNQDVEQFLRRWLKNVAVEQFDDGEIPVVVPYPLGYNAMQKAAFGSDTSAGWGDAVVMVPWTLYQVYGDRQVLEENWPMMERWMGYAEREAAENLPEQSDGDRLPERGTAAAAWRERQKYLWNTGFHFGDWLYPSCRNEKGESDMFRSAYMTKEYIATEMFARSAGQMAQIAAILGRHEAEEHYRTLNGKIRRAFAEEYIREDGVIPGAPQGVYVLALAMKMGEAPLLEKVADHLAEMIHENGDRLDTGFLSIPYLLDVLMAYGHTTTAAKLLYQDACPSWLYEVKCGATTMWERWDAVTEDGRMTDSSYNHYAFGCVGDWMYRTLLGLAQTAPGWKTARVEPSFAFGLTQASGSFTSRYGTYSVAWTLEAEPEGKQKEEQRGELILTVPVGARAEVILPGIRETAGSGTHRYQFSVTPES